MSDVSMCEHCDQVCYLPAVGNHPCCDMAHNRGDAYCGGCRAYNNQTGRTRRAQNANKTTT